MRSSSNPIASDWEQSDDNITNTRPDWIDDPARYALRTQKERA
jgi:hypothetical protein